MYLLLFGTKPLLKTEKRSFYRKYLDSKGQEEGRINHNNIFGGNYEGSEPVPTNLAGLRVLVLSWQWEK